MDLVDVSGASTAVIAPITLVWLSVRVDSARRHAGEKGITYSGGGRAIIINDAVFVVASSACSNIEIFARTTLIGEVSLAPDKI
jgi:hypothetical protein